MRFRNGHVIGAAALILPPASLYAPLGATALMALTAVAALLVLWREGRLAVLKPGPAGLLLIAFVGWAGLSLLWTVDPGVTLDKAVRLAVQVAGGLILLAAAGALDENEHRAFAPLAIAGVVVALALLLVERLSGGMLIRLAGVQFADANALIVHFNRGLTLLALAVWAALLLLWRRNRRLAAALALAALIVFSAHTSGAALAGLIIGLLAFAVARIGPRRAPMLIAAVAALYIAAAPFLHAWILSPQALHLGHRAAEKESQYWYLPRSSYHRLLIWNFTATKALEHPVIGWGFRTSRVLPGGKILLDTSEQALPLHPHNGVLQIWVELGAVGAALAAAFAAALLRRLRRWPIGDGGPEAGMALFATGYTIVCTSFGLWQSWWLAALFMGAAFCIAARGPVAAGVDRG